MVNNCMTNEIDQHEFDSASAQEVIARLTDNDDLVDLMINIENYLDNNDMYSFKNWIRGEIVGGPYVKKYWVKVTLKWSYNDMPDPNGALRLLKHGTRINYQRGTEHVPVKIKSEADYQPGTKKPRMKTEKIWLVELMIPRKFVEGLEKEVLDLYDEDLDLDTVDDAVATGETPEQAVQS
jgi:hypothetical protein